MARQYLREVTATVNGVEVVNDRNVGGFRVPGFRINFRVTHDLVGKTNRMSCNIFNLGEGTRGKMKEDKAEVRIEAGYPGNFGLVFSGTAAKISSEKTPTGYVTSIEGKAGLKSLSKTLNKSFPPGTPYQDILLEVVQALGVDTTQVESDISSGKFTSAVACQGYALAGLASVVLNKLGESFGFSWSIQNDELVMLRSDGTVIGDSILLTPDTGLLGSTTQIIDERRKNEFIVKGRALLHAGIIPGRELGINDSNVSGFFKVTKVQHSGDTHGENWFSDFEAVELGS